MGWVSRYDPGGVGAALLLACDGAGERSVDAAATAAGGTAMGAVGCARANALLTPPLAGAEYVRDAVADTRRGLGATSDANATASIARDHRPASPSRLAHLAADVAPPFLDPLRKASVCECVCGLGPFLCRARVRCRSPRLPCSATSQRQRTKTRKRTKKTMRSDRREQRGVSLRACFLLLLFLFFLYLLLLLPRPSPSLKQGRNGGSNDGREWRTWPGDGRDAVTVMAATHVGGPAASGGVGGGQGVPGVQGVQAGRQASDQGPGPRGSASTGANASMAWPSPATSSAASSQAPTPSLTPSLASSATPVANVAGRVLIVRRMVDVRVAEACPPRRPTLLLTATVGGGATWTTAWSRRCTSKWPTA